MILSINKNECNISKEEWKNRSISNGIYDFFNSFDWIKCKDEDEGFYYNSYLDIFASVDNIEGRDVIVIYSSSSDILLIARTAKQVNDFLMKETGVNYIGEYKSKAIIFNQ